jgi:hypothetical protein
MLLCLHLLENVFVLSKYIKVYKTLKETTVERGFDLIEISGAVNDLRIRPAPC